MTDAAQLAQLIYRTVYRFSGERALQDGIEILLKNRGIEYLREFSLSPRDRIDFMVGKIGIEIKVDSSASQVQRQLWRYAEDDRVSSLILVTTKMAHKQIAYEILEKPVIIVHLLNSIF